MKCFKSILFFILNFQIILCDEFTIIRNRPVNAEDGDEHQISTLLCITDTVNDAIIWNTNLVWRDKSLFGTDRIDLMKVSRLSRNGELFDRKRKCNINADTDRCKVAFVDEESNWRTVLSTEVPMGPVVDGLWETFTEHNTFEWKSMDYRPVTINKNGVMTDVTFGDTGTLVVSIRGGANAHFLLCGGKNYSASPCYWIIIGGWQNRQSGIRKCLDGVNGIPKKDSPCKERKIVKDHMPLTIHEWKTFVITWNAYNSRIIVYDSEDTILDYIDRESDPVVSSKYHIFFGNSEANIFPMQFRFHHYNYTFTDKSDSLSVSDPLNINSNGEICIDLMIGLCASCKIHFLLVSGNTKQSILQESFSSSTSLNNYHGLPMWQYARISASNLDSSKIGPLKLEIRTQGSDNENNHFAIRNFRQCLPEGTVKRVRMIASQDRNGFRNRFWPKVTCQRLSYNKSHAEIISPLMDVTMDATDPPGNLTLCPENRVGPQCATFCDTYFDSGCRGAIICDKNSCYCPQGYKLYDCETPCSYGEFGYGCKQTCENCRENKCDIYTGNCKLGCTKLESKYQYVPPYCKDAVEFPELEFDQMNTTTLRVYFRKFDEDKKYNITYEFDLEVNHVIQKNSAQIGTIDEGKPIYFTTFNNLRKGMKYNARISQNIKYKSFDKIEEIHLDGDFSQESMMCIWTDNFKIKAEDQNLTINKFDNEDVYPCPDDWYSVKVFPAESASTKVQAVNFNGQFPMTVVNLTADTKYVIYITGLSSMFKFRNEVSTLPKKSSPVRDLHVQNVTSTEAFVIWKPPEEPNGVIYGYHLTIVALRYAGCISSASMNLISPQILLIQNTSEFYIVRNLIPYVIYQLKISAFNKREGAEESKYFLTKATDMPSAIYENLTFKNNEIRWSQPIFNCSTITGPINASRLFFFGVSENVKDFTDQHDTEIFSFILNRSKKQAIYGAEEYRVRIHALRKMNGSHNESAYSDIVFTTDPLPPPKVRNLTIVEVNKKNRTMLLKWRRPLPPTNGRIIKYRVVFAGLYDLNPSIIVLPNESCPLWENWLCKTVEYPSQTAEIIKVSAKNNGTFLFGEVNTISNSFEETAPNPPGRIFASKMERGMVDIHWEHPFRTGGPMQQFEIQRELMSTRLKRELRDIDRNDSVYINITHYQKLYKAQLNVLPSTHYKINIKGVVITSFGKKSLFGNSSSIEFKTKSLFSWAKDEPSYTVDNTTHLITLSLPLIGDYTDNGRINVVVIGEPLCKKTPILSESLAGDIELADGEVAWHVGTFLLSPLTVLIGEHETDDKNTKCPLRVGNSYVIVIVVREENIPESEQAEPMVWRSGPIQIGPVPRQPHEIWAVPLLLLIIIVAGLACYLTRKKKRIKKSTNTIKVDVPRSVASLSKAWKSSHVKSPSSFFMTQRPDTVEYRESIALTPAASIENIKPTPIDDETYEKIKCTSLVKLNEFQDYVKRAIASGKLNEQYSFFPRGQMKSWAYGELPENRRKNRYGNLIAYDETRVILEKLPDDPHSDYINANYIKGYKKNRAYIATQGPKPTTVIDFWRMVWQERVQVICMLANVMEGGKTKCEQYWPEIGKVMKYGNISVTNISHVQFADYTFRYFHLKNDQEIRKIDHLHYTAWPDHGIPLYTQSVVSYLKKLLATPSGTGPVLVHCSAGVGRTGTIILCDICLRRAAAEGVVDVFGETDDIRKQRANMVDNKQQYILAHVALVECLLSLPTAIPCNDLLPTRIQEYKNQLSLQQQRLEQSAWQDEALQSSPRSQLKLSEKNMAKNRFPDLLPVTRMYIPRYPINDDDSSYIYGVHVDSARRQNNFVATQLPLPTTVADFWRMVAEFKVQLIIILQPPDTKDPTCCKFVPEPEEEISPLTFLNIKGKSITDGEHCTQQKITLADNSTKITREQSITIISCKEWDPGRNKPPPTPEALVDLWQVAERISRSDEPAVVMCHDGVTGCGFYLAMSFLLERMGLEHECDVCLAIRAIRRSRPDFCQGPEQFEYLYDAALIYNGYFETYANFT